MMRVEKQRKMQSRINSIALPSATQVPQIIITKTFQKYLAVLAFPSKLNFSFFLCGFYSYLSEFYLFFCNSILNAGVPLTLAFLRHTSFPPLFVVYTQIICFSSTVTILLPILAYSTSLLLSTAHISLQVGDSFYIPTVFTKIVFLYDWFFVLLQEKNKKSQCYLILVKVLSSVAAVQPKDKWGWVLTLT